MKTKKNGRKFKVGDRVQVPYGPEKNIFGTIVEDRGNLAAGKRLLRILVDFDETTFFTEVAEDELTAANGGEITKKKIKNRRKFKVGDRVQLRYGVQDVIGTIVEDRGNLAVDKWFFDVKVDFGDTTFFIEVPEDELTAAS
jgi:hypothetical protein